jgi:hypothetical protein
MELQSEGAGRRLQLTKKASLKVGLVGLMSTAMMVAFGSSSRSSSSRFCATSTFKLVTPVRLPPGRIKLATSPTLTGSTAIAKTIGMVAVAALAAIRRAHANHRLCVESAVVALKQQDRAAA